MTPQEVSRSLPPLTDRQVARVAQLLTISGEARAGAAAKAAKQAERRRTLEIRREMDEAFAALVKEVS